MKKFIYTFALALVVGVSMLGPTLAANAAVPSGIDVLINGGTMTLENVAYYNASGTPYYATSTYTGVWGLMTTFVGDILDNYTSLAIWLVFLGFILYTIIDTVKNIIKGGTKK